MFVECAQGNNLQARTCEDTVCRTAYVQEGNIEGPNDETYRPIDE